MNERCNRRINRLIRKSDLPQAGFLLQMAETYRPIDRFLLTEFSDVVQEAEPRTDMIAKPRLCAPTIALIC
jgi:hypothetical protein